MASPTEKKEDDKEWEDEAATENHLESREENKTRMTPTECALNLHKYTKAMKSEDFLVNGTDAENKDNPFYKKKGVFSRICSVQ